MEQAEAISKRYPGFEPIDIPAGAFKGQPSTPHDDIKLVGVSYRIVAPITMMNVIAGAIAKSIIETKARLTSVALLSNEIELPDPDEKNPLLAIHPGVKAYLEDGDQSFIDQARQYLYAVGIPLSLAGSAIAVLTGIWRKKTSKEDYDSLQRLLAIAEALQFADPAQLEELELEAQKLFTACLSKLVKKSGDASHLSVFLQAIDQVRRAADARRSFLMLSARTETITTVRSAR